MDANRPHSADLSDTGGLDLLGFARRHWWLAVLSTVLGVGGALQFTSQQTKVYESSTSVLVQPTAGGQETKRSTIVHQVNSPAGRLNELATTTVSDGQIIRDADLPSLPSRPNKLLNLASGAMIGLLLGVAAGLLRERLDKRVRRASDLPRRADVPVIASVPARMRPRLDDVVAPFGTGGRTFNRLRNEVLASMPPPLTGDARAALAGQVVVVAGASRGAASTVVAANLAAAFARTGAETVFVSAHLPDSLVDLASVDRMLGVRAVPGLSDMLAGRVPLRAVVQRAP